MILSGCGVLDGSEIHESVCALLHLDRHDATVTMAAPNDDQPQTINHLTSQPTGESRNMRIEAARIARGEITDLADVKGTDFDAIVLPGGFGAAKNLCTFADEGADCAVHPQVERVLNEAHEAGKVIGFICISPTIGARVFRAKVTVGVDEETAAKIEQMGASHERHATEEICVDEDRRIVSTPAYMSAERIGQVYEGIGRLVDEVLAMAGREVAAAKT
jgi:enhancing lycopene biosynthesis protein 2